MDSKVTLAALAVLLVSGTAMADRGDIAEERLDARGDRAEARLDERGDRAEARLDERGDRIEDRLDDRGDRIDDRLDTRSDRAAETGHDRAAARLDARGDRADARLDNSGQSCNAAKRFIVLDEHYDAFVEKFTAAITAVEAVDPNAPDAAVGPLSSQTAADRLQEQLDRAVAQGATLTGGTRSGAFVQPGVLTDVPAGADARHEEFFGPIAQVYRAADEAEAVAIANDTPYGLGSYVYSTDPEQAARVADRIEAGMVFVNLVLADGAELPFGGIKRSGSGRELGRFATDEFVNKKLIRVG